ncbi:hypothetical protein WDW37_04515 [Bdellovibrionota bacterium FG-1]
MKKLTMTGLVISVLASVQGLLASPGFADARVQGQNPQAIPTDSYEGKDADGNKEILMVRPLSGRNASMLGLLVWDDLKIGRIYVIDPIQPGISYMMTPLQANDDGSTGMNEDPSLTLTLDGNMDDGRPGFTIASSGVNNLVGFQGSIRFKAGDTSHVKWTHFQWGRYKNVDNSDDKATISPVDPRTGQATAVFGGALNGSYVMRQRFSGFFVFHKTVVSGTGTETDVKAAAVGMFILGRLVVVDPNNGKVLARYKFY